jgi:hypothetical protein
MNSNSPVATGAAAISGAMLGGVIVWFCSAVHIAPPPADVAGTLGAAILIGGHCAVNWINARFPTAPVVPVVTPATPATPVAFAPATTGA